MDTMYGHALAYGHLASPSDELEYPVWQHQGTPVNVQCKSGLQMACDLDQSAMVAGRMRKTCTVLDGGNAFSDPLAVD